MPEALSSPCAAPTVITPGKVQPGIGIGRSSAPVQTITRRARVSRDRLFTETRAHARG